MSCPICLKQYSSEVDPYILQPCAHGVCKVCLDVLNDRGDNCPVCRGVILRHTPNYDLRSMFTPPEDWQRAITDLCVKEGVRPTVTNAMLPVTPLIVQRLMHNPHLTDALTLLVRNMSAEDAYEWVEILYPKDPEVHRELSRLVHNHSFLEKYKAGWLLEFL